MSDKSEYFTFNKDNAELVISLDNKNGNIESFNEKMDDNGNGIKSKEKSNFFHSVSIVVEPVIEDDTKRCIPLRLTPSDIESAETVEGTQSSLYNFDDFIFENQRKRSQEEEEIVQSIFADARLRKEEFARLLEEHAQIVSEINKAETTLL